MRVVSSIALGAWLLSRAGLALAADPLPAPAAPQEAVEPGADMGAPGAAPAAAPVTSAGPTAVSADADAQGKFAAAPEPVSDSFATDEGSSDSDTQR